MLLCHYLWLVYRELFACAWKGCGRLFDANNELAIHLHTEHVSTGTEHCCHWVDCEVCAIYLIFPLTLLIFVAVLLSFVAWFTALV